MSKRNELREKRRRAEKVQTIFWIGFFAVLAVLLIVFFVIPSLPKARPHTEGLTMGDPNAPVKVEEFSDFQCPGCGYFYHMNETDFVNKYVKTGKVLFTYTPLSFLGPESIQAARAAYCADEQGKFWDYHDILFDNQNGENQGAFADSVLTGFASDLKLDQDAFNQCLQSEKFNDQLAVNDQRGSDLNVVSTPSFIVNGELVPLDQPEDLYTAIEAALGF